MPAARNGSCGRHIERVFAAHDFLATVDDDAALLARRFCLVDEHRLEQRLVRRDGAYVVDDLTLVMTAGMDFRGSLDAAGLHVLDRCDGRRTVGAIVDDLAERFDVTVAEMAAATIATVRRLVALGFLVPVGDDEPA